MNRAGVTEMGEEISKGEFSPADFSHFEEKLRSETELLRGWFNDYVFERSGATIGYELEAWCMDEKFRPAPRNEEFLKVLDDPMVVEELARFNVEFNAPPENIGPHSLRQIHKHLQELWGKATSKARDLDMCLAMIGILPTVTREQLTLANMSNRERYRALNKQVLRMRHNNPMHMDIEGRQHLTCDQRDVMLESAATSLQIHLQIDQREAARVYNAAQLISAPIVAATSNSPYLFGYDLWAETRIPLFEQAVNTADESSQRYPTPARVGFGDGYLRRSLLELFNENLDRFPVLLPAVMDAKASDLCHLRLHNGTIWRWNRPLVGFADDGVPHLRIEHRVIPAGPSIPDIVANIALFLGAIHGVTKKLGDFEQRMPFARARENFYTAARHGLDARIHWLDGGFGNVRDLLLKELLPMATEALQALGIDDEDTVEYMSIITRRVELRRTGTDWQRAFISRHGNETEALVYAYWKNQESGAPVCEWEY